MSSCSMDAVYADITVTHFGLVIFFSFGNKTNSINGILVSLIFSTENTDTALVKPKNIPQIPEVSS